MLRLVGDINFSDGYFDRGIGLGSKIKSGLNPFIHLYRSRSDFWIGNLECTISSNDNGMRPFEISERYLSHIPHLDLYGVANNHIMQYGDTSFKDTTNYLNRERIPYAGGLTQKSHKFEHQGKKVGIIAFSQRPDNFSRSPLYWNMPEYADIISEIDKLSDCDFKIAFIHWGIEFINYPYNDQKQFARFLIDSGINLVTGMHPHVSQGSEQYNGGHIFYSLGNCVFNMPWSPTRHGLIVNVDLKHKAPLVSHNYLTIDSNGFPMIDQNEETEYSIEYLNNIANTIEDNEKYYAKAYSAYKKYRNTNRTTLVRNIILMKPSTTLDIIKDFIFRKIKK